MLLPAIIIPSVALIAQVTAVYFHNFVDDETKVSMAPVAPC